RLVNVTVEPVHEALLRGLLNGYIGMRRDFTQVDILLVIWLGVLFYEHKPGGRYIQAGFFFELAHQRLLGRFTVRDPAANERKILTAVFIAMHDERFVAFYDNCPCCLCHGHYYIISAALYQKHRTHSPVFFAARRGIA